MCGIAGFCMPGKNWEIEIHKMNERMFHRGPDAGGYWKSEDDKVVFGHRRLSIVDLTPGGAQPMISASGRYAMVFNGEIYNYKKLKERLLSEKKVSSFRGTSDTEVLLEAFEHYGVDATLQECKGMFAIALYDKQEKVLRLMRDRVGEKPLYYGFVNGRFVFASDLGSIREMENFHNPIETKVLNIYFVHGYIPAPYSIYQDIYKLEPGCVLTIQEPFTKDQIRIVPYWSMMDAALQGEKNPFKGTEQEASLELERLLKEAIKDQMVADVPVGAFLSAGIDSSTIVSLMQELSGSKKVHTYTIGMQDKDFNEAVIAKQIAGMIGTEHTEMYIDQEDAKAVIPQLAKMFSEPFADSSQIPTYLVSKLTRQHVTVSLSGDAGDELFCGYGMYTSVERIWNKMKGVPYFVRKPISTVLTHNPLIKDKILQNKSLLLGAKSIEQLYEYDCQEERLARKLSLDQSPCAFAHSEYPAGFLKDPKSNLMLMNMKMYHPDDILVKVDRAAMAVSLETRVPMLDRDVIEFAWSLPIEYKYSDGVTKRVLRDILYRYVPKEIMERPKTGFSIPIHRWLKEKGLRDWAEGLLNPEKIKAQGILDEKIVSRMWEDYMERDVWRVQIWYLLMFQAFMEA